MHAGTFEEDHGSAEETAPRIERRDTGLRIVLSLLFAVIWGLLETLLAATIVLSLIWTLVLEHAPPLRLRRLTNRLVTYSYQIWRYLTQNTSRVPFPFSDLPRALEPPDELGSDEASEVRRAAGWDEPR